MKNKRLFVWRLAPPLALLSLSASAQRPVSSGPDARPLDPNRPIERELAGADAPQRMTAAVLRNPGQPNAPILNRGAGDVGRWNASLIYGLR